MTGPAKRAASRSQSALGVLLLIGLAGSALMITAVALVWLPGALFLAGVALVAIAVLGVRGLQ